MKRADNPKKKAADKKLQLKTPAKEMPPRKTTTKAKPMNKEKQALCNFTDGKISLTNVPPKEGVELVTRAQKTQRIILIVLCVTVPLVGGIALVMLKSQILSVLGGAGLWKFGMKAWNYFNKKA